MSLGDSKRLEGLFTSTRPLELFVCLQYLEEGERLFS